MTAERRRVRMYFHVGLLLLVLAELFSLTGWLIAPHKLLRFDPNAYSPFLAFAVGSIFVTHLVLLGHGSALRAAVVIGGLLFGLHNALFEPAYSNLLPWLGLIAYYLGLGSLILLSLQAWLQRGSIEAKQYRFALRAGLLPVMFVMLSWPFLEGGAALNVLTLDSLLLHFDGSLGFQPSLEAGQTLLEHPKLAALCSLVYSSLPIAISLLYAWQCRQGKNASTMHAFVIAGVIGSALYLTYPAAGPHYLLGSAFPWLVPDLTQTSLIPEQIAPAFLNAMPSLHMAWALLLWFGTRTMPALVRLIAAGFLAFTVLATLGLGEHYLIDLVVAYPLALLAYTIANIHSRAGSRTAIVIAVVQLIVWLLYLRLQAENFAEVGRWHWLPIIVTLCICLWPYKHNASLNEY